MTGQCPAPARDSRSAGKDSPLALAARDLVYQIDGTRIIDGVAIGARRGEFIGLIGPNGAGKTTLLKTVSGLLKQQEGAVWLEGTDLGEMSAGDVAKVLAMLPQLTPYTFGFTALEVVMMGRYPHMGRFQVEGAAERRLAIEAMRLTETDAFVERTVASLSGGERQRVFLARALAQQPKVLLLDEPTANLDVQYQLKALDLVRSLVSEGMTAIAAIHDLPLAARYCHRLVLMCKGRVLAEGTPETVLTPQNIEEAFGVRAVVYPDPLTGALTLSLVPTSRDPDEATARGVRVHVVCGGGTGGRLMYELLRAGFEVTAGVLGAGDADRRAADILGVEYVPAPAFGGIDDHAHAAHLGLLDAAEVVVLCETPFGANNLRNLEALRGRSRLLTIQTRPFAERDYTGGEAQRMFDGLAPIARCAGPEEAVAAIGEMTRPAKSNREKASEKGT
ncbi:MAG: ABC transporter ATP-binding protein [Chloroflexi bacterium]|nr:ABC transporter ATP-binding protein [Chloroflexota bacterium]